MSSESIHTAAPTHMADSKKEQGIADVEDTRPVEVDEAALKTATRKVSSLVLQDI